MRSTTARSGGAGEAAVVSRLAAERLMIGHSDSDHRDNSEDRVPLQARQESNLLPRDGFEALQRRMWRNLGLPCFW